MSAIGDVIRSTAVVDGERVPVMVIGVHIPQREAAVILPNGDFAVIGLDTVAANLHWDGNDWKADFEEEA